MRAARRAAMALCKQCQGSRTSRQAIAAGHSHSHRHTHEMECLLWKQLEALKSSDSQKQNQNATSGMSGEAAQRNLRDFMLHVMQTLRPGQPTSARQVMAITCVSVDLLDTANKVFQNCQ
jgi:hypothetical protein